MDFNTLKSKLVECPVLALPQPHNTYLIDTDASSNKLGAVILQLQNKRNLDELATNGYWSRTLK